MIRRAFRALPGPVGVRGALSLLIVLAGLALLIVIFELIGMVMFPGGTLG